MPIFIAVALLLGFILLGVGIFYGISRKDPNIGYQPKGPIPFSHRVHVKELGLDCRYCHTMVETRPHASIPALDVCMNCHQTIGIDNAHIQKMHAAFKENKPIEWINVHNLPDFVYFDHSRHVNVGLDCATCHGQVDEMDRIRKVKPFTMAWCLDCHRDPISFGEKWANHPHIDPSVDCNTCHR